MREGITRTPLVLSVGNFVWRSGCSCAIAIDRSPWMTRSYGVEFEHGTSTIWLQSELTARVHAFASPGELFFRLNDGCEATEVGQRFALSTPG